MAIVNNFEKMSRKEVETFQLTNKRVSKTGTCETTLFLNYLRGKTFKPL